MFSGQAIIDIQNEAAERAANLNLEPFALFSEETAFEDLSRATNLGDYMPEGWVPAKFEDYADCDTGWKLEANQGVCAAQFEGELIVWASKFGRGERSDFGIDELKLLAVEFYKRSAERGKTLGFAICEEGQFQLYLRGFEVA